MPPNRLCAGAFFLTYSQSALSKESILARLKELGTIKRVVVGHEHHQDGNDHFHTLVEYARKKDVAPTHFDLEGEHPNVKVWDRVATYDQWLVNHWTYCHKEDPSPLKEGDAPSVSRKRTRDDKVLECVRVAREEGLVKAQERALEIMASDYSKSLNSLDALFMRESNAVPPKPARSLSDFHPVHGIPENWKVLFFYGPTGLGKTAFARAMLPNATLVSHRDQIKTCRFSDGIIWDDSPVSHWPPTAVIHLLDWDEPRGLDVKHGHVVIPPGTRKIICYNGTFAKWCGYRDSPQPDADKTYRRGEEMTLEQYEACERRLTASIYFRGSLFGTGTALMPEVDLHSPPGEWGSSIPE